MRRRVERRGEIATMEAASSRPVLSLGDGSAGLVPFRRVFATGEYDRSHEIVLRGSAYHGIPGVRIFTPLRITDADTAVLVLRGFVPSPDATDATLDSLEEPGLVTVSGIALAISARQGGNGALLRDGHTTWRWLDLDAVRRALPYAVREFYILQARDTTLPRFPIRLLPPPADDGGHLNYAIQWFAFGVIAIVVGGLVGFRKKY